MTVSLIQSGSGLEPIEIKEGLSLLSNETNEEVSEETSSENNYPQEDASQTPSSPE